MTIENEKLTSAFSKFFSVIQNGEIIERMLGETSIDINDGTQESVDKFIEWIFKIAINSENAKYERYLVSKINYIENNNMANFNKNYREMLSAKESAEKNVIALQSELFNLLEQTGNLLKSIAESSDLKK